MPVLVFFLAFPDGVSFLTPWWRLGSDNRKLSGGVPRLWFLLCALITVIPVSILVGNASLSVLLIIEFPCTYTTVGPVE